MKTWRWLTFILCAAVLAANAWHLAAQTAPPAWDDAWYLENSFRFYYALKQGLLPFLKVYAHAFRTKAPLISLAPLPLYALFGPSERVAVWVNELFLPLTWVFVYKIARKLYHEKAALASVAAAALLPLLYGLSRYFLVECLLTALVAWASWVVLETPAERPAGRPLLPGLKLGCVLGLGILAKSIFPLYLLGPVWLKRRSLLPHAKPALVAAGVIASSWYAFNAVYVLAFGLSAGFGTIARDYGSPNVFSPSVLSAYAATLGGDALSWPYTLCAGTILAGGWRTRHRGWRPGPSERFLLAWLILPLGVFTLGINKEIRYLAPALPALAIAIGVSAAAAVSHKKSRLPLALLLTLPPLCLFSIQTFGLPRGPALAYNGPPEPSQGWDRSAVLAGVAAHAHGEDVIAVAFEHRLFNANNLASLSASRGYRFEFINLGYAQPSDEGALIRLKDKGARFVLALRGVPPPDLPAFLNRANEGISRRLETGELASARLAQVPVAPGVTAVLYRLTSR